MDWVTLTKPSQAAPGIRMICPSTGTAYTIKRRGRVEGRVGILIEFKEGGDVAVVEAKNSWLVEER